MADELKKVAAQLGDEVKILKLDTDKNPNIATALQIQGLPTLVFVGIDPKSRRSGRRACFQRKPSWTSCVMRSETLAGLPRKPQLTTRTVAVV